MFEILSPIELNWNKKKKRNIPTDRGQKGAEKNRGNLSNYHVYCQNYSQNVKNGSFFVFSADDSKKITTVWAKYLNASERS